MRDHSPDVVLMCCARAAKSTIATSAQEGVSEITGKQQEPPTPQRVGVTKSRLKRTIPQLSTINPSASSRSPEGFLKPVYPFQVVDSFWERPPSRLYTTCSADVADADFMSRNISIRVVYVSDVGKDAPAHAPASLGVASLFARFPRVCAYDKISQTNAACYG